MSCMSEENKSGCVVRQSYNAAVTSWGIPANCLSAKSSGSVTWQLVKTSSIP